MVAINTTVDFTGVCAFPLVKSKETDKMDINYSETVGWNIRKVLKEKGFIDDEGSLRVSQGELWDRLNLDNHSEELYRRIFFRDYHPSDYEVYDEIAKALGIESKKLTLLAHINKAPEEIRYSLQVAVEKLNLVDVETRQKRDWDRRELIKHISELYEIAGFNVEEGVKVDRVYVPLTIKGESWPKGILIRSWVISSEAASGEISPRLRDIIRDIDTLQDRGDAATSYDIIITGKTEVPSSRDIGLERIPSNVNLLTPLEFEDQFFGRENYLENLSKEWERSPESDHFIKPKVDYSEDLSTTEVSGPRSGTKLFDKWIYENSRLLVVSGGFGTGKSTFLHERARALAVRRLSESSPSSLPIPLFIDLRKYAGSDWKNLTEQAISHFMREELGIDVELEHCIEFLSRGPFVIFLDGLDEYSTSFTEEEKEQCKEELKKIVNPRKGQQKVVVSLRREMFSSKKEILDFFHDIDSNSWLFRLNRLNTTQIRSLLTDYIGDPNIRDGELGEDPEELSRELWECVEYWSEQAPESQSLDEQRDRNILSRPLLVRFVAEVAPSLARRKEIRIGDIHKEVVDAWIQREREEKNRKQLTPSLKRKWLFWLAQRVIQHSEEARSVHLKYLPREFWKEEGLSINRIDEEMRFEAQVSSFLCLDVSDEYGKYAYAYKSFEQYCFARKISQEIESGERDSFGSLKIQNAGKLVTTFLEEMARGDDYSWTRRLRDWLCESREPGFMRMGKDRFTTANALYLLSRLKNGDLSGESLSGLYLGDTDLEGVSLEGADLRGSLITRAKWEDVDLDSAQLSWAWFHDCDFKNVSYNERTQLAPSIVTGDRSGLLHEINASGKDSQDLIDQITPEGMFYLPGDTYKVGTPEKVEWYDEHATPEVEVELDPLFMKYRLITNEEFEEFLGNLSDIEESSIRDLKEMDVEDWHNIQKWRRRTRARSGTGDNVESPDEQATLYYLYYWNADSIQPGPDVKAYEPVVFVRYDTARDYAHFYDSRLPTEHEYEAALGKVGVDEEKIKDRAELYSDGRDYLDDRENDLEVDTEDPAEGFMELFREWCLDRFSPDHRDHDREQGGQHVNPYTGKPMYLLDDLDSSDIPSGDGEHSEKWDYLDNEFYVLRGFRASEYTPPHEREALKPNLVNQDQGFRTVKEVWMVLQEKIDNS